MSNTLKHVLGLISCHIWSNKVKAAARASTLGPAGANNVTRANSHQHNEIDRVLQRAPTFFLYFAYMEPKAHRKLDPQWGYLATFADSESQKILWTQAKHPLSILPSTLWEYCMPRRYAYMKPFTTIWQGKSYFQKRQMSRICFFFFFHQKKGLETWIETDSIMTQNFSTLLMIT